MTTEEKRDKKEFSRIRNYYRNNFENGDSDESFIIWLEGMCEKYSKDSQFEEEGKD